VFRTDLCLNPFLHSKMDFKQQKIVILCRFMSLDSGEKIYFVEQLDNVLEKSISNLYHYNLQYTQLYKVRTVKPQGVQILFVCDAGASPTSSEPARKQLDSWTKPAQILKTLWNCCAILNESFKMKRTCIM
jgi:hypothetical protein